MNSIVAQTPVTLLTGYLGAGKNHSLESHSDRAARQALRGHRQRIRRGRHIDNDLIINADEEIF